jgi:uncharacterized surface protein with fasciclin (FAS1) repeats
MNRMSRWMLVSAVAVGAGAYATHVAPAPALADHHEKKGESAAGTKDVVDTAVAAGQFKTLAAALQAGGLVDTLKGDGPFTVFAPTDEAFKKLPAGTVESLLKPENKEKLVSILKYHVVAGNVNSSQVAGMSEAKTVEGKSVKIKAADGKVMIDNATVTKADIAATNGVIHVIDTVLIPQ